MRSKSSHIPIGVVQSQGSFVNHASLDGLVNVAAALSGEVCGTILVSVFEVCMIDSVTDYRHYVETQDRHPEGSMTASIYWLQITIGCRSILLADHCSHFSYLLPHHIYFLRVYIEPLELPSQSSRSFNSPHCKAYRFCACIKPGPRTACLYQAQSYEASGIYTHLICSQ